MATAAEIATRIAELEDRMGAFAGVKATTIGDQSTTFDLEGAQKELARLRNELALLQSTTGSRTRYAVVNKGV